MTDMERKTFCAALSRYGAQAQIMMLFEEMAELQDVLCKFLRGRVDGNTLANIAEEIARFPAADVAPVVHGRWIHSRYEDCSEQFELVKCSQCNHEAYAMAFYVRSGNYCPNCGAKMDGGANE